MDTIEKFNEEYRSQLRVRRAEDFNPDIYILSPSAGKFWHCSLSSGFRAWAFTLPKEDDVQPTFLDAYKKLVYVYGEWSSFEDFCTEYGLDADSRKAEQQYKKRYIDSKLIRQVFGVRGVDRIKKLIQNI